MVQNLKGNPMTSESDCLCESVSPADLQREAMRDATLHAFYRAWNRGDISWDQFLMGAVVHLSRQKQQALERLSQQPERFSTNHHAWLSLNLAAMTPTQIDALAKSLQNFGVGYIRLYQALGAVPEVLRADRVIVDGRCIGRFPDDRTPQYDPNGAKEHDQNGSTAAAVH
jgi:hypothetical protein